MVRKIIPDIVSDQDVLTLAGDTTVREAVNDMAARAVNSILVSDQGRLTGIFTGTDLIKKVIAAGRDPDQTPVSDVMTRDPETVGPDGNALEALHRMHDGRFSHLPVVEDGKVLGVLSRRDFLGYEVEEVERQEDLWEKI